MIERGCLMKESMGLGGAVVSRNVLEGKGKVRWCVREAPVNDMDNGWRILSDIDTNRFLSKSGNMMVCDWGTLVEIEPAVMVIFNMPVGTDIALVEEGGKKFFVDSKTGKAVDLAPYYR